MSVYCHITGRRGAGHAEALLQKYKVLGFDPIGLQQTRRPGRTAFAAADYRMFCSGEDGRSGRIGQHEVGRAVKKSIICEATWIQELTHERQISINLASKSNAITFVVAYGATDILRPRRRGNRRMYFGWIWIVLLVECSAATTCSF